MVNLKLQKDNITLILPLTGDVEVGGEEVYKEVEMASGKLVRDVIGYRAIIEARWEAMPADIMAELHELLRKGGYFTVTYSDPTGERLTGSFKVSYPTSKIFKFINGAPYWYDVKLKMTAQGVL